MDNNLKKRCVTAIILLPAVIFSILLASSIVFAILSSIVFLLAGWEWTRLSGFIAIQSRILALLVGFISAVGLIIYLPPQFLLYGTLIVWLFSALNVVLFPFGRRLLGQAGFDLILGICFLTTAWYAINQIRQLSNGPFWALFACTVVWIADTAAYFAGKRFGRHLLAPTVSPKKTWEGAIGALLGVGLWTIGINYITPAFQQYSILHLLLITVGTAIAAILGDLIESLLKRVQGMKDSGRLLPGHGGILDRIDGLIAAFPVFLMLMQIKSLK